MRDNLGIKDLPYHDLRREGASRIFEAGFSIEEVTQVIAPSTYYGKFTLSTRDSVRHSLQANATYSMDIKR